MQCMWTIKGTPHTPSLRVQTPLPIPGVLPKASYLTS